MNEHSNFRKQTQLDPKKSLDPEKFISYQKVQEEMVDAILNHIKRPNMKICDIGGANGVFLDYIIKNAPYPIEPYIIEINDYYKKRLVNKKINFIHGSILDGKIQDNFFDFVVFRHVLHHLVSNNIKKTYINQINSFNEIFRITKSNGYVIFVEEVNQIRIFSNLLYVLSKSFSDS